MFAVHVHVHAAALQFWLGKHKKNKITASRCRTSLSMRACCLRQVSCYILPIVYYLWRRQIQTNSDNLDNNNARSSVSVAQQLYIKLKFRFAWIHLYNSNKFVRHSVPNAIARMYIADVACLYSCTLQYLQGLLQWFIAATVRLG